MHGESSTASSSISPPTNSTQTTITPPSSSLQVAPPPTSADTVNPENITPAQVLVLLQFLLQVLQTDASFMQQPPTTAMSSQSINCALPSYSTAQHHTRTITNRYQDPLLVFKYLMMMHCLQPQPYHL